MLVFFFNDTATTEIYTRSLHDALPISPTVTASSTRADISRGVETATSTPQTSLKSHSFLGWLTRPTVRGTPNSVLQSRDRSEEHTSELQSRQYLVCRLLLEKKKKTNSS